MKNCDAQRLTIYFLVLLAHFITWTFSFSIYFVSIQDATSCVFKAFKLSIYQQKDVTNWMLSKVYWKPTHGFSLAANRQVYTFQETSHFKILSMFLSSKINWTAMWFLVSTASCADGFEEPSQVAKKKKNLQCCKFYMPLTK